MAPPARARVRIPPGRATPTRYSASGAQTGPAACVRQIFLPLSPVDLVLDSSLVRLTFLVLLEFLVGWFS